MMATKITAASDLSGLHPTACPICETDRFDQEIYAMNFSPGDINADVFSARRLPDRLHYRMVRCSGCGLLRSNPIFPVAELERLYQASRFTYADEAEFTRQTYGRYLERAAKVASAKSDLLEIGCGNGFFLEEAKRQGFAHVFGIEPSREAISQARSDVQSNIRCGLYDKSSFEQESVDLVCAFQVFDHVPDPDGMVASSKHHLRRGGIALFINHDSGAPLARILGERNPIIDVEHTALYDKKTMRRIFEKHGFTVLEVFSVANTYPLSYWTKLAPLPGPLKSGIAKLLDRSGLGKRPITLSAGNLGLIARKD